MFRITPRLHEHEEKIRSQNGEDGVIRRVAQDLGIEQGTFFEFGIGPAWESTFEKTGLEGNFVLLREQGWTGTFIDDGDLPAEADVRRGRVTPLNINRIWRSHAIPARLDFLSIDVDGQEFWIWMALEARPKVVIVEYNGVIDAQTSITIQMDEDFVWDNSVYHGSSLLALNKLAVAKSYTLVWANGVNAMFVRDDLVANPQDFAYADIYRGMRNLHAPYTGTRIWVEI